MDRKRMRLTNYDYSLAGMYFVTVCTHKRINFFWNVGANLCVRPECEINNDVGIMIDQIWNELPNKFRNIFLDEYIIMHDHIHAIIGIDSNSGPTHRSAPTIPRVIQWFKTMTTNNYIQNVKEKRWLPFDKKLWQRGYYDRVIRNEK